MIEIQDTLVSEELLTEFFCCDLSQCRGQCCVEGDAGAPVLAEEVADLEEAAETLSGELTEPARRLIGQQGVVEIDRDGDIVTSCVCGGACVFATEDKSGCTLCTIDRAHREGRFAAHKPISCALYPIRLRNVGLYTALNYHRWGVCDAARAKGRELGIRVFQFLREPLIRRFGEDWWAELELVASEMEKQGLL